MEDAAQVSQATPSVSKSNVPVDQLKYHLYARNISQFRRKFKAMFHCLIELGFLPNLIGILPGPVTAEVDPFR